MIIVSIIKYLISAKICVLIDFATDEPAFMSIISIGCKLLTRLLIY
jgi:hypothetical protein